MSNRAMRRAAAKGNHQYLANMTREAKRARMVQNGITPEDLKANYDIGYDEGSSAAVRTVGSLTYTAIAIALKDVHGFGKKRILRIIREVDRHVQMDFSSIDAAEELLEKTGIRLNWNDPIERVQEA